MKSKNSRRRLIICLILSVIAISLYLLASQHSAVVAIRWFLRETGIPLEIRKAAWDFRWGELLRGEIRKIELDVRYAPIKMDFSVKTPVRYVRHPVSKEWSIQLEPLLNVSGFPQAQGTVDLKLMRKRFASVRFDLHQTAPLKQGLGTATLEAPTWNLKAFLSWDPVNKPLKEAWQMGTTLTLDQVKVETAPAADGSKIQITTPKIETKQKIFWPDHPPTPMQVTGETKTGEISILAGPAFFSDKPIAIKNAFMIGEDESVIGDLSTEEPMVVGAHIEKRGPRAKLDLHAKADLKKVFEERLAGWLEPIAPALSGAKATGVIALNAKGETNDDGKTFAGSADLDLKAKAIDLPAQGVKARNLTLKMPIAFTEQNYDWGRLKIDTVDYHSVTLKKLDLWVHADPGGVYVTTEDEKEKDHRLRQRLWGGAIDVEKLYASFTKESGFEIAMAVKGGPFELKAIQQDLCIAPDNPLKGKVSFYYPRLVQDKNSLHLVGDVNLDVFNGSAHLGDLHLDFTEGDPRLSFDADWNDLDLAAIGEWSKLGDVRGSLNGHFRRAKMYLTQSGIYPYSYEFMLKGAPRGGNDIRFYGRAMESLLESLGVSTDSFGTFGKIGLWFFKTWRNFSPSIVHYMGFKATADNDWTSIETFDPEYDSASNYKSYCDVSKNRFLLCGERFTITLNTHGVYPAVMKTESFHRWLADRVAYFKRKVKDDTQSSPAANTVSCKPLW